GCGYLGMRAALSWRATSGEVTALTRSSARADDWRTQGIGSAAGDVLQPESLRQLPACDVLLYAVGYDRTAGVDKRQLYVDGLRNVLNAMHGRVGRFVYVSSSSVYGEDAGGWEYEASPTQPQTEGGRI
ncbi:MAG: NAD(P)H-binding protein, partial [Planctomycetaceae bacterium]